jgi:enoyl-CoA hydratase/carnithine racemase
MTVRAEVGGRVGWITLDRPPENRLDAGELEELDVAVGREAEVAVAVIRSGAEGCYSAGAERLGMVDRLVPAAEFDQAVGGLAKDLAAGAPLAVAAITRVVNDGLERPLDDALDRDLDELAALFASGDAREGMTAAQERRAPGFTGR